MLVHKRRTGQGVVFEGLLRVTVEEFAPEVWLSFASQPTGVAPVISPLASRVEGKVRLGIRAPSSYRETEHRAIVTTDAERGRYSELVLARDPGDIVEVDGISIEVGELVGGEHNGKPRLRITAPGLSDVVEVAVLTRYSYAVDIATAAPQSIRIYRTEVWAPAADANEDAAGWTDVQMRALERRPAPTA